VASKLSENRMDERDATSVECELIRDHLFGFKKLHKKFTIFRPHITYVNP
jgi:hypothetical protein